MSAVALPRPMREADLDCVVALAAELAQAPHWSREVYRHALDPEKTPRRWALVIELSGKVVGFAVASLIADESELESIAVALSAQRLGLGGRLCAGLIAAARAAGARRMLLEVRASNHAARNFYQALGWSPCGQRKRYYADPEEDAVLLEIAL